MYAGSNVAGRREGNGVELRVLRYFEAIARLGSATAAAREQLVAQPSISRQIRALEKELGTDLFHRDGYHLVLTRAGNEFLVLARDILRRADQAREAMTCRELPPESRLVIACPPETARYLLAPMIACGRLGTSRIQIARADRILDELDAGHCDIAVGPASPDGRFEHRQLGAVPLTAQVLPATVPWEPGPVEVAGLAGRQLVRVESYRGIRKVLDRALAEDGSQPGGVEEVPLPEIAQAVAANSGRVCILCGEAPQFGLRAHELRSGGRRLKMDFHAYWRTGHFQVGAVQAVLRQLAGIFS
ncbi:LysR family transcriptional regulator [Arthrobacter sp. GCM10027362]|uniref:LysR family transcriptional regulator n=1 Tax=Arthrobacter sp. GCM10027362 TaxID=3273379 RepID=UPI003633AA21